MRRRDFLGGMGAVVGASALSALAPEELWALGQALHRHTPLAGSALAILDAHQNATVIALAEHIIPGTDTPGATAARVNEFIDRMLAEWYTAEEREAFLRGLADVDRRSHAAFGHDFVTAQGAQQQALLHGFDAEVAALRSADANADQHFFHRMKYLTLYGFYTSEIGATTELQQSVIPGRYDPCAFVAPATPGAS